MIELVIKVSGGRVTDVYSSDQNLDVEVLDLDENTGERLEEALVMEREIEDRVKSGELHSVN